MAGQKTEKPTAKRRNEQRKQGNVVVSQDIVGAVVLLSVFGILRAMGGQFTTVIAGGMKSFLGGIGQDVNGLQDMSHLYLIVLYLSAEVLVPIFAVNIAASVVATMAQTKLLVAPKALKASLSKLNPINGLKGLFSPKALVEVLKSIVKIVIIGSIIFNEIKGNFPKLIAIYNVGVGESLQWLSSLVLDLCFKATAVYVVIGVADYFFQWWDYERRLKMSKEEIKEEFKQTEGNPETKSRIMSEMRRMSQMRMMQAVPSADVVIRNPTHYAIALKYDRGRNRAPVVVAKGQNIIALKIVEIAEANRVECIENRPLAQALYKTVEVGDEIPEQFYKAVAEVLAYIYKLKRAGRG